MTNKNKLTNGMERVLFSCSCYHPEHHFFVLKDDEPGYEFLSIQIRPNHFLPWYKRVWVAMKYALGLESGIGYDEVLLSESDRKRLVKVLNANKVTSTKKSMVPTTKGVLSSQS